MIDTDKNIIQLLNISKINIVRLNNLNNIVIVAYKLLIIEYKIYTDVSLKQK